MKITAQEQLLVVRSVKRDEESIQTLVTIYGRPIYGFLISVLGHNTAVIEGLMTRAFNRCAAKDESL